MANIVQQPDGSASIRNEADNIDLVRWGGPSHSALGNSTSGDRRWTGTKWLKVKGTAGNSVTGSMVSIANPEGTDVLVVSALVYIRTLSSVTVSMDMGVVATSNGTSDNLIDGLAMGLAGATGVFDNITDKGSNGKSRQPWIAAGYINGHATTTATASVYDVMIGYVIP